MMSARIISVSTYVSVCAALILLTVLTVWISFVPLAGNGHILAGLGIAVIKASLVVLFFMHAVVSPRVTWGVIVVSIFWMLLLLSLTLADYWTRMLVPYVPGH